MFFLNEKKKEWEISKQPLQLMINYLEQQQKSDVRLQKFDESFEQLRLQQQNFVERLLQQQQEQQMQIYLLHQVLTNKTQVNVKQHSIHTKCSLERC